MKLCKWTGASDFSHNSFKEINKIKQICFIYLPELNIECEVEFFNYIDN